jgi:ribosomal protein L32
MVAKRQQDEINAALAEECPKCGALPGHVCRDQYGSRMAASRSHLKRFVVRYRIVGSFIEELGGNRSVFSTEGRADSAQGAVDAVRETYGELEDLKVEGVYVRTREEWE